MRLLKESFNPRHPRMIERQVNQIFEFVDINQDGLIELDEMIDNIKYFIDNPITADSVHDEL